MEVILTQNVKNLGKAGDKIKVTDGYARNFLLPKKLAMAATSENLDHLRKQKDVETQRKDKKLRKAEQLADHIKKISCTIVKQVSEGDKLFGSVTVPEILKCLEKEGIKLEKKQILLDSPIKNLGIYPVKIKLAPSVESVLKVWVVK